MKETWAHVELFRDYLISTYGRVYSIRNKIYRKLEIDKDGYLRVRIYNKGRSKKYFIHRLVAITFMSNDKQYPVINHKNEIRNDNNLNNLEWCTVKYNYHYSNVGKKVGDKLSKKVAQYDMQGHLIKVWPSTMEAGRNGYDDRTVASVARGYRKQHKGYRWVYI